ncbi:MAG: WD40 repeat domain-containing protein, partial [Myxococcota bacterium]|nr:WD40 repeat domain-containing protein [Myxococcota bacterium]
RLAVAARHWDERGRPVTLLWRGAVLDDLAQLEREGITSSPLERAFATQSVLVARRSRRRTIAAILAAFGVLATGIAVLAWANRRISTQRETAIERLAASFEERGRLAIEEGDAPRATLYLAESRRLGARGPGGDLLIAHAAAALEAELEVIGHTESPITLAQIDPGVVLAIGSDGTLRRWQGGTPTLLAEDVFDATLVGATVVAVDKRGSLAGYGIDGKRAWQVESVALGASSTWIAGNATSGVVVTSGPSTKLWSITDGAARGELATQGPVRISAFDASGSRVATGGLKGSVEIFEVATGKLLTRCPPHDGMVNRIQFTPDGGSLVTGGADREVLVCDPATGNLRHRLRGHRNKVSALVLSRDGRYAASGSRDGGVYVWDLQTGLVEMSIALGSSVKALELSPDGRQLATTARDGSVRLWDRTSSAAIGSLQGHAGVVTQTLWEGSQLVTASLDGSIRRWDVTRASRALSASHGAAILDFDLRDGLAVSGGADGRVIVWNHVTQQPVATLVHETAVTIARLSPDLRTVATVDASGAAALWSLADHRRIATVAATGVARAAFLPDGTLVTSHAAGALRWWHADGRAAGHVELGFRAAILTVDPAGRWLAASPDFKESGELALIDLSSRRLATKLPSQSRNLVAFGRDRLALSRGAIVELVELGTWRRLGELQGHQNNVNGVWYLPDGRLLTAGDDAKLVAWSPSGQLLQTLATGGDIMLDVETSPDGTLLAAIGYEGTLRLFDVATLQRLLALPGHVGFSTYLQFTRDGSRVVSGGNDGRIISWDVRHPTRTLEDLATLVRCRVPLRLEGDIAVPRKLDFDDSSCGR